MKTISLERWLVALLLMLFSLPEADALAQEKIRVGLGSISLQSGLVHIAKDRGLFAKYGLAAESLYVPGLLDKLNYQLVTTPEIKTVEQLKGKKFAVSRFGSSADFGMRALLKRVGVDPVKESTILQIGDEPARIAAVTSGNVEGTVVNAPFTSEAERLKLNVIAD